MKYPLLILLTVLCLLSLGQVVWYYPQLPGLVASHFNAAGQADGWMPRAHMLKLEILLSLGATAGFAVLALVAAGIPDALINLPHRAYWLAPVRREETRRCLSGMVLSSGCGTLAFLLFLHQRVLHANLDGTHQLTPSFGVVLTVALVLIVGPVVRPLVRFWRPPAPRQSDNTPGESS
jgi:uncharacterized membrane protein